jgi:hypothetical protein
MEKETRVQKQLTAKSKARPKYEPPKVVTYKEDELLKQMGPVGGCTSGYYNFGAAPSLRPQKFEPSKFEIV